MHKIPRLIIRLKTNVFKDEFAPKMENSIKEAEIIRKSCDVLRNNLNFQKFLKIALDLGNSLNQVI